MAAAGGRRSCIGRVSAAAATGCRRWWRRRRGGVSAAAKTGGVPTAPARLVLKSCTAAAARTSREHGAFLVLCRRGGLHPRAPDRLNALLCQTTCQVRRAPARHLERLAAWDSETSLKPSALALRDRRRVRGGADRASRARDRVSRRVPRRPDGGPLRWSGLGDAERSRFRQSRARRYSWCSPRSRDAPRPLPMPRCSLTIRPACVVCAILPPPSASPPVASFFHRLRWRRVGVAAAAAVVAEAGRGKKAAAAEVAAWSCSVGRATTRLATTLTMPAGATAPHHLLRCASILACGA